MEGGSHLRKYRTIQGDMWDGIARKVYGHERHMNVLLDANPEYRDIWVFPSDIVLKCPEVSAVKPSRLPPWRSR